MTPVMERLAKEHARLRTLLEILERELAGGPAADFDVICGILDYMREYPRTFHHPQEDALYRILSRRAPYVAEAAGDLLKEHDELACLTDEVARLAEKDRANQDRPSAHFREKMLHYLELYREHMRIEDELFLPAAARFLTTEDLAEIEGTSPVCGGPLPPVTSFPLARKVL
ncbi:MAG: hemerythrin domain-containing protein [Sphingomonadales bacterium]